ncbi:MAG: PSD1 domain-containing protein [Pirellulales bacterium]|nr:PSD1 domain-containing protein [Pirellulales bacterium]
MRLRREVCRLTACASLGTWALVLAFPGTCRAADAPAPLSPEALDAFERRVRPVLVEHCYECHSGEATAVSGELRLDSLAGLARGGSSGATIDPGDADASLLISALRYESLEMPPQGKLPADVVDEIAAWVGELDTNFFTAADEATGGDRRAEPAASGPLWSLQPPRRVAPPKLRDASRVRTEVDRFVLARLESHRLPLAPDAAPRDLLRRLSYDLTGLPPSAEEAEAFAADPSDDAYAAAVHRMMTSPQYGERWARLWLDLARYADTKGYVFQESRDYPGAWKYRDWVVAALNADMPYDEFLVAQLAGEQTAEPTAAAPAAGFLTLGRRFLNNPHDIIDDRIDVTTRSLLGLTVACARCHDHKYDPIPTADYYALYGVFASSEETVREELPPGLADRATPVEPVVFLRGNPGAHGPHVVRRFLTCLTDAESPPFQQGSGRLELARRIASPDNPLTARVWVNRVWARLLGRGLVTTPSDFGTRGEPPTHPELLDWLATEFVDRGWSTKRLVRQIVLSTAYRQSTVADPGALAIAEASDPDNTLLWRAHRKRLDLEQYRDSLLTAAGRLDATLGGAPVSLTDGTGGERRALYGFVERQNLPAFFRTFDFANPNAHSPQRAQTTSPHQALYALNSPVVIEAACGLAARAAEGDASGDPAPHSRAAIERLFRNAIGRSPAEAEVEAAAAFLASSAAGDEDAVAARSPWSYGWGKFDEASQRVEFAPFGHFTGTSWQTGPEFPHPELAYAHWSAGGGHPGSSVDQAVVLRFTAAKGGSLRVSGRFARPSDQGDGVRLRLVSSRLGQLAAWDLTHGEIRLDPPATTADVGEQVDLVVECRGDDTYDTFELAVEASVESPGEKRVVHRSTADFHGPEPPLLDRWQQLAQALLMSNEFLFLD